MAGKRTCKFTVSLPFFPRMSVKAPDKSAALEAYRRYFGILDTDHEYTVGNGGGDCASIDIGAPAPVG